MGAHVVKGQSVTLNLSRGITTSPVTVKDYVGLSVANAENEITVAKLGYKLAYTSNPPSGNPLPNVVLSAGPIAGTKTQTGAAIVLTLLAPNSQYPLYNVNGAPR